MLAKEIREWSDADVTARIAELEEERFRLRFRSATEALAQPLRLREVRKDLARLKTVQRERQVAGARATTGAATRRGPAR